MSVLDAIRDEVVVSFDYGEMRRTVSPYSLADDGSTFLGWDHSRDGLRRFALDRIAELDVADESYVYPVEP